MDEQTDWGVTFAVMAQGKNRREAWLAHARRNLAEHDFASPPDPARTIHVDPLSIIHVADIHQVARAEHGTKLWDFGRILDGDDDLGYNGQPNPPVVAHPAHVSVQLRYGQGIPWDQTPVFTDRMRILKQFGKVDGCRSREELLERYRRLDAVYEALRSGGYRIDHVDKFSSNIFVTIGRDGDVLHAMNGNHRLAMARALRLPTIEVYVMARHRLWQQVRDQVAAGQLERKHPDLVDVVPSASLRDSSRRDDDEPAVLPAHNPA